MGKFLWSWAACFCSIKSQEIPNSNALVVYGTAW
jgi:hypothetical protein